MALVSTIWRAVVTLVDSGNNTTQRTYEAPNANFADFAAFRTGVMGVLGLRDDLLGMTDAEILSIQMSEVLLEDALALPAAGVEIENQAFFSGKIAGAPNKSGVQSIPAPKDAIFINPTGEGRNIVDMSDAAVLAWLSNFDDPGGNFTISDGEQWTITTVKGKRRHVKSING